ncbi:MAG: hypothetical protein WBE37_04945 [Bryobacteraceae bacterium]
MSESTILEPNFAQPRPTFNDVELMSRRIGLNRVTLPTEPFGEFLRSLQQSHDQGGAHLAAFDVGPDVTFDWFASRNRLSDENLIDSLIIQPAIRAALHDLAIPELKVRTGLVLGDSFQLDGRFAHSLHYGGAYWSAKDDGRYAKTLALEVCDAMFGLRYGEIAVAQSSEAWTPWFRGVAWDLTEVVFDRRLRKLWIFAMTDTD